jgi:hypothetical protein
LCLFCFATIAPTLFALASCCATILSCFSVTTAASYFGILFYFPV